MSCPDCFRGGVSTQHPTGTETTLHGRATYVARPDEGVSPKGVIVYITDAFGWKFVNNRVLCDHYAKRGGYIVYCPDFMDGNAMDTSALKLVDQIMEPASWVTTCLYKPFYVMQSVALAAPWMWKCGITTTNPRVVSFVQAVRTSPPPFQTNDLKVAAAGFCWGGKHTVLLAQDNPASRVRRHESQEKSHEPEPLLDCAFTAHPSLLDVPTDIDALTIPTSVAIGDNDMAMKLPLVQQMEQIMKAKKDGTHEVVVMPGAKHGFAVRCHPDDKYEMECAEKAEVQAIGWFDRWCAKE
jgi:dienelactone hydrolase